MLSCSKRRMGLICKYFTLEDCTYASLVSSVFCCCLFACLCYQGDTNNIK